MAAENEELQGDTSSNAAESARYPSLKKSISVMSSIYLGSIIFGFAIGIRSKKDFESSEFPHGMYEPPGRVALRALGWGTLLSVCGTTAVVAAMAYALGIRNVSFCWTTEFSYQQTLLNWLPDIGLLCSNIYAYSILQCSFLSLSTDV